MRSLGVVALVVVACGAAALLSPGIAVALRAIGWQVTFGRVYDRVFEVGLVAGFLARWRRLDLGTPDAIGLRARSGGRDLARGIAIGFTTLAIALAVCWLAGALVPALRFPVGKTVRKALLGFVGAIAIGIGEETLFRGIVLRRLVLDAGRVAGIAITAAIYAAVHVLRTRGASGAPTGWSGLERTATVLAPLLDPTTLPALIGLAGLGVVLAVARLGGASLWLPIGIHATWVAVFRVGRLFFDLRPSPWLLGPGWPPVIGGAAGWLAVALAGVLVARAARSVPLTDRAPFAVRAL